MTKISNKTIVIILIGIITFSISAQNVKVSSSVDKTQIFLNDVVTFTVTVSGSGIKSVKPAGLNIGNSWRIQNTSKSTSQNIQIVGGRMQASKNFNYIFYLSPMKNGTLTIPSVDVYVNGRKYTTKPIKIKVAASTRGKPSSGRTTQIPSSQQPKVDSDDNIFLSVITDKKTVYEGEQINVDFMLYSAYRIENVNYEKDAEFKNFWIEPLYQASQLVPETVSFKGKRFSRFLLQTIAAFPLRTGTLTIEPMVLNTIIRYPSRGFFDFGRRATFSVKSNRISIKVLPLPTKGKPDDFIEAVGQYSLSAEVDRNELPAGEALSLKVRVSGYGNIETVTMPQPILPTDFEDFDHQVKVSKDEKGGKLYGTKEVEYVLVPGSQGEYEIPSITFSYFDPKKKKYIQQETEPIMIKVLKGKGGMVMTGGGRSGIVAVGGDIEFIKSDSKTIRTGGFNIPWGLKSLWFLPIEFLLIFVALAYRTRYEKRIENIGAVKSSLALNKAKKKLNTARRMKNRTQAIAAIYDSIFQYIGDKLGMEAGAVIFDDATIHLKESGVEDVVCEGLREVLDVIHASRFAPAETDINVNDLVHRVLLLLKEIDAKVGRK